MKKDKRSFEEKHAASLKFKELFGNSNNLEHFIQMVEVFWPQKCIKKAHEDVFKKLRMHLLRAEL